MDAGGDSVTGGLSALQVLAIVIGGATGAITIAGVARELYRKTLGRRRELARRMARLGTGAQLSFFEAILGEPPAMRNQFASEVRDWSNQGRLKRKEFVECFFIDREYYVQTISTTEEKVLGFSVSARGKRFHPKLTGMPQPTLGQRWEWWREHRPEPYPRLFEIQLGRTTFAELQASMPDLGDPLAECGFGARWFTYTERRSFGNPGHYQDFVFTMSSAVGFGRSGHLTQLFTAARESTEEGHEGTTRISSMESIADFRRESAITTFTVIAAELGFESWPVRFGPHGDEVRTIP